MLESPASRLTPSIKKRWVSALRSGDYTQNTGALHSTTTNSFCCLGVLADLAVSDGQCSWDEKDGYHNARLITRDGLPQRYRCPKQFVELFDYLASHDQFMDGTISPQVNKADLFQRLPSSALKCGITCEGRAHGAIGLIELNDQHDFTFNEIADVIEVCL